MRQGLIEAREGHPAFPRSCVCGAFRQSGAHIAESALGEASAPGAAISCQFISVGQTPLRKHCRRPGTSRSGLIEAREGLMALSRSCVYRLFGTKRREADAALSVCPARVKPWSAYARHPSVFAVKGSPSTRPGIRPQPYRTALRPEPNPTHAKAGGGAFSPARLLIHVMRIFMCSISPRRPPRLSTRRRPRRRLPRAVRARARTAS